MKILNVEHDTASESTLKTELNIESKEQKGSTRKLITEITSTSPVDVGNESSGNVEPVPRSANKKVDCFTFSPLEGSGITKTESDRDAREALKQWGVSPFLITKKFRVSTGNLEAIDKTKDTFLLDFFNDELVQASLNSVAASCEGQVSCLSGRYKSVESDAIKATVLNTTFFDRLSDPEVQIIGKTGYLKQCLDAVYDGATSQSRLTDMFLNEESENAYTFEYEEQEELLYKLLRLVAVGGSLCQPEMDIKRYMDVIKVLYKDLVSVYREEETNDIKISSMAFQVNSLDSAHHGLFPKDNSNNACYVTLNPETRILTYFSFSFVPFW